MRKTSDVGSSVLESLGIGLVFAGYGGNVAYLSYIGWETLSGNWLNILNPLADFEIMFRWILSVPFWLLVAITATGHGLGFLAARVEGERG